MGSDLLKGHRGFSLVEVMIGGAILAGLGLAGAYIFKSQRSAQKAIEAQRELQQFHQVLTKQLTNPVSCNRMFNLTGGAASTLNNPTELSICNSNCEVLGPSTSFSQIPKGAWTDGKQNWIISDWALPANANSNSTGVARLEMTMTYTINPKLAGNGYPAVNKRVVFGVRYDSSGRPKECIDINQSSLNNLQNDMCNTNITTTGDANSGAVLEWDENLQRCTSRVRSGADVKTCLSAGGIVKGIDSKGVVNCITIKDRVDNNSVNENECKTGTTLSFEVVNGQIRVRCN